MKILVIVLLVTFIGVSGHTFAAPAAPEISYALNGTNITIDWTSIPNATGYTLYFTEYPYSIVNTIGSADAATLTSVTTDLWEGAAFYLATQARQGQEVSDVSNIVYFIMDDHEVDWSSSAYTGEARTRSGGAVIGDKVYIFGGYDANGQLLNSLDIYDPVLRRRTEGAPNSDKVADLSGAAVNGTLYVFGATGENCATTGFAEKYIPALRIWSELTPKPTPASAATAVVYEGKIYLFGGWQRGTCVSTEKTLLNVVEMFDPATNSWSSLTAMPKALEGAAVTVYDDKAYVLGGVDEDGKNQVDVIAFDFKTNSWIESGLGALKEPRVFPSSSVAPVIDETILLVGGWFHESGQDSTNALRRALLEDLVETDTVQVYNPRSRSTVIADPLPSATADYLPAVVDGELFVIGGVSNNQPTDNIWKAIIDIANITSNDFDDNDGDEVSVFDGDCDDNDSNRYPGNVEICEDNIDQDCDELDTACVGIIVSGSSWIVTGRYMHCPDTAVGDILFTALNDDLLSYDYNGEEWFQNCASPGPAAWTEGLTINNLTEPLSEVEVEEFCREFADVVGPVDVEEFLPPDRFTCSFGNPLDQTLELITFDRDI